MNKKKYRPKTKLAQFQKGGKLTPEEQKLASQYAFQIEPWDKRPDGEMAKGFDYWNHFLRTEHKIDDYDSRMRIMQAAAMPMSREVNPTVAAEEVDPNFYMFKSAQDVDKSIRRENYKLRQNADLTPKKPFGYGELEYKNGGKTKYRPTYANGGYVRKYQDGGQEEKFARVQNYTPAILQSIPLIQGQTPPPSIQSLAPISGSYAPLAGPQDWPRVGDAPIYQKPTNLISGTPTEDSYTDRVKALIGVNRPSKTPATSKTGNTTTKKQWWIGDADAPLETTELDRAPEEGLATDETAMKNWEAQFTNPQDARRNSRPDRVASSSSNKGTTDTTKNTGTESEIGLTKGQKWALTGQGLSTAALLGMSIAQRPEKEKFRPITTKTPELRFDETPLYERMEQQRRAAVNAINENTTSAAVRRANLLATTGDTSRQMSELGVRGQEVRNQLEQAKGQFNLGKDTQNVANHMLVDDLNARNRAASMQAKADAIKNVGNFAQEAGNMATGNLQTRLMTNAVSQMSPMYGFNLNTKTGDYNTYFKQPQTEEETTKNKKGGYIKGAYRSKLR